MGQADAAYALYPVVLGEKRAPLALLSSGFVLSIPVFFDTVFYLLVPLARSLHRRTQQNYLRYLMAIATGGAITHTLVPPTPGPLLVAGDDALAGHVDDLDDFQIGAGDGHIDAVAVVVQAGVGLVGALVLYVSVSKLPAGTEKMKEIAQAIAKHQVIVLCGETGSGKSTLIEKIGGWPEEGLPLCLQAHR